MIHQMSKEHYERTRQALAQMDAEAAARVEEKRAAGLYQRRPDPRKQTAIPAGTAVKFDRGGRKVAGTVERHEDRKNTDGENDYGWGRIYWIRLDGSGQVVPVDSEQVHND